MEYNIFANGIRRCPVCGGALRMIDGDYRCFDCRKWFRMIGTGVTDKDLICEEIRNEAAV